MKAMNLQCVGHVAQVAQRDLLRRRSESRPSSHLLMRQLEEFVEQAEFVDQLERRGMDGVAAEVAQEVLVLFQHDHVDAGPRQQEAEHHAGRPAAGDATGGVDGFY